MFKKLIILMTALLLCTSFISCGYKDTHVKIIDENTLKYKGEKYILVDEESEPFINVYPVFSTQVYITERGTPGFLAKLLCEDSNGTRCILRSRIYAGEHGNHRSQISG